MILINKEEINVMKHYHFLIIINVLHFFDLSISFFLKEAFCRKVII